MNSATSNVSEAQSFIRTVIMEEACISNRRVIVFLHSCLLEFAALLPSQVIIRALHSTLSPGAFHSLPKDQNGTVSDLAGDARF
jgi:hypothetical protein